MCFSQYSRLIRCFCRDGGVLKHARMETQKFTNLVLHSAPWCGNEKRTPEAIVGRPTFRSAKDMEANMSKPNSSAKMRLSQRDKPKCWRSRCKPELLRERFSDTGRDGALAERAWEGKSMWTCCSSSWTALFFLGGGNEGCGKCADPGSSNFGDWWFSSCKRDFIHYAVV
jgi:hypothetical protein